MTQSRTLLTAEDFWQLYAGKDTKYELVKGELVEMAPVGGPHGIVASRADTALRLFLREHPLGEVVVELGFCLECRPDTVRGSDVAFIRAERIPAEGLPEGFFSGAPDLAVEVVSPSDTAIEVQAKVQDYLSHGTLAVWVMYPRTRSVMVYRADGSVRLLTMGANLTDDELLPGFFLPLGELFG
jgi:Uma2 family endonuclease